jgi:hypothetical protein
MFSAVDIRTVNLSILQVGIDTINQGFLGLHIWTWQRRLHISASYSHIQYNDNMVVDYLHQMAYYLCVGLELNLRPTFEI